MRLGLLLSVLSYVCLGKGELNIKYDIINFDADEPQEAGKGDWVILLMDDKSVKAGRLEEIFYKAVEMLQDRDNLHQDEKRALHFVHWDVTVAENKQYQKRFFGEIEKDVTFPDILVISEKRKTKLSFQIWGNEANEERLMNEIDGHTAGRLEEKTCDEIEHMVEKQGLMTFVYFGPHKYLLNGQEWNHVQQHAYADRRLMWEEPIQYVYNEDDDCKEKLGGGDENVIQFAAFKPGFPVKTLHILDDGVVESSELKSQAHFKRWLDHAFMWNTRDWNLRQLKVFEETAGFMLTFLPQREMWDYNMKMKEQTGENAVEVELVRKACEELHDKQAAVACIITPLTDEKRDAVLSSPLVVFPSLKEKSESGTPIYAMAKKKQLIHQFPADLSLPENKGITYNHLLLWVRYWQLKDQLVPYYQNSLYTANAQASLEIYRTIEIAKKEMKQALESLELVHIQVRKKKEAKVKKEEPEKEEKEEAKITDEPAAQPADEEIVETIEL